MNLQNEIEWEFGVRPSEVDLARIYSELSKMNIFSRASYLVEFEKNAPHTFNLYRDKYEFTKRD